MEETEQLMVATATETEHLNQTGLSLVFNPSQKLGKYFLKKKILIIN